MKENRAGIAADGTSAVAIDEAASNKASAAEANAKQSNSVTDATGADVADTDPFADPFFTDPAAAAQAEKKARKTAREARRAAAAATSAADETAVAKRAELELLMAEDNPDANGATSGAQDSNTLVTHHFDMNEIARAEKKAARRKKFKKLANQIPISADDTRLLAEAQKKVKKGKHGSDIYMDEDADGDADTTTQKGRSRRNGRDTDGYVDDFEIDVSDPRFAALYESHEYAIDPTNARFRGTKGMKALLEEGRRVRGLRMGLDKEREMDDGMEGRQGIVRRDVSGSHEGEREGRVRHGPGKGEEKMSKNEKDERTEKRERKRKRKQRDVESARVGTAGKTGGDDVDVDALIAKIKRARN